ncbi:hypothetical protein [Cognatilysobacter terrigena]|uniref:hypothetical protein n=1 Tax=Cognatilysobacter terrigena TaxID=2488749 RepID=UPI00105EBC04|nr:hypothetical protein [Lysobacter terrigena]
MSPATDTPKRAHRLRALGRTRYVLLVGVAGWALPVFVCSRLLPAWLAGHLGEITMRELVASAAIWALGVVAFGLFMWHVGDVAPRLRQNNERTTQ